LLKAVSLYSGGSSSIITVNLCFLIFNNGSMVSAYTFGKVTPRIAPIVVIVALNSRTVFFISWKMNNLYIIL